MRIASIKTIRNNKKIRRSYAYNAIERGLFEGETENQELADKELGDWFKHQLPKERMLFWAIRDKEFRELTE